MRPRRPARALLASAALLALACDAAPPAAAQPPPPPLAAPVAPPPAAPASAPTAITIGERFTLDSKILGETRELLVYKPTLDPGGRYPVIYLLDGDAHFHHVTGLVEFLAGHGRMPPVIVVGLTNTDRGRDLTPTHLDRIPTSGGADKLLDFFARELFPDVDARLPTAPYRILIGHSLGGLFALHAFNTRDLFDAYVAISPSTGWDGELPRRGSEALFRAKPGLDKALYVSVGDEPGEQLDTNRAYARALAGAPASLRWRAEEMPREDHGSLVHRSVYHGLELIFDGWQPPPEGTDTLAKLEAHWAGASTRFRTPPRIPEGAINQFGYKLLGEGKLDEAIAVFRRAVALYPESANPHDSLGEALEKKGDLGGAAASYALAVDLAARKSDPALAVFRANLARVTDLAAKKPG